MFNFLVGNVAKKIKLKCFEKAYISIKNLVKLKGLNLQLWSEPWVVAPVSFSANDKLRKANHFCARAQKYSMLISKHPGLFHY